ncbi:hypothetical protein LO762_04915 [Actinocorallia sp. API 0066]|uniref:hypothetical protein n=1 Tax=Actinocorallia sp. API 0066 TaxID=2896846 RepID=UPI001E2F3A02|nr:hypothetical protein [Actinocorallia sp. API 0066]MCD0448538.1 hypothetical protein [Actinocorallia sp. API 0066]
MSEEQEGPPVLATSVETAAGFRVVLPAVLGEGGLAGLLAGCVNRVHGKLVNVAGTWARHLHENPDVSAVTRAYWRGKHDGYSEAAESLVEEILGRSHSWDQEQVFSPSDPASVAWRAEYLQLNVNRPEVPLPVADPPLADLVAELLVQRDFMVGQAVSVAYSALCSFGQEKWPAVLDMRSPDFEPILAADLSQSRVWAMAADSLEQTLAQALGHLDIYVHHIAVHGYWLDRIRV